MSERCRHLLLAVGLAVAVSASGCSWVMVRQVPSDYRADEAERPPDCTASLGPPISDIWDAVAIGGGLIATGTASLAVSSLDIDPAFGVAQLAGGVGLGTMFGFSARYGFATTRRCRVLRDTFQQELYERTTRDDPSK